MTERAEAAVGLILRSNGKGNPTHVLTVTNRKHGGRSLPGGKLESGETASMALVRELREELGIAVDRLAVVNLTTGTNEHLGEVCEVSVFLVFYVHGQPKNVEPGTTHEWLTWEELCLASPFADFYRRRFPSGINHLRPTTFT